MSEVKEERKRPSLEEVLDDAELLKSFEEFSVKHLCNEHIEFYKSVENFKKLKDEDLREEASRIVLKFLLDDAQDLVGSVSDRERERITKLLLGSLSSGTGIPPRNLFDIAQKQTYTTIDQDTLTRWWVDKNGTFSVLHPLSLRLTLSLAKPAPPPPKKKTPLKLMVLCDDNKTAMDTGSFFVHANFSTAMNAERLNREMIQNLDVDVLVIDTASRSLPEREAKRIIEDYANIGLSSVPKACTIVKRIDILLNGNIGAEIDALLALFNRKVCIFAPASPDRGYITVDGHQYKDGTKVEKSEISKLFAGLNFKIEKISIADIEKGDLHLLDVFQEIVFSEMKTVVIVDAKTADQMALVLSVAAKIGVVDRPIVCGSKGLLGHLAKSFGFEKLQ